MIDLRKRQKDYRNNGFGEINYIIPISFSGDECVYYEVFNSRKTAEYWLSKRCGYMHSKYRVYTLRQAAKAYPQEFKY